MGISLDSIKSPQDIKNIETPELIDLAAEIRKKIIEFQLRRLLKRRDWLIIQMDKCEGHWDGTHRLSYLGEINRVDGKINQLTIKYRK